MKAPPPLTPAQKGNFQIAPRPMAEPALAKMNPKRELHSEEVVAIKIILFRYSWETPARGRPRGGKKGAFVAEGFRVKAIRTPPVPAQLAEEKKKGLRVRTAKPAGRVCGDRDHRFILSVGFSAMASGRREKVNIWQSYVSSLLN